MTRSSQFRRSTLRKRWIERSSSVRYRRHQGTLSRALSARHGESSRPRRRYGRVSISRLKTCAIFRSLLKGTVMSMPGFNASQSVSTPSTIARKSGPLVLNGPDGPITIDGNCECVEKREYCFGGWTLCLPLSACYPIPEVCLSVCTRYHCTAS